jgi:hypothetical protein
MTGGAGGAHTVRVTMALVPDDQDPVLAAQLAHLDAIEQRHEELYRRELAETERADGGGREHPLAEDAWPEAIGEPPPPDGLDLQPYVVWLDRARAVLAARAGRDREELQRLESQWVHVFRNVTRYHADDVAGVVDQLGRVRERIAAGETCGHLLRLVRAWLRTWQEVAAQSGTAETELRGVPEPPLPEAGAGGVAAPAEPEAEAPHAAPADVELVRRLLDEGALDRARDARALLGSVLEALSGIALDMEVAQRQAEREPETVPAAVRGLQERIAGLADDLRALPGAELAQPQPGEPLHAVLRRCVGRYQPRLSGDVAWTGAEPASEGVRAAVLWIVQEFLAAASAGGATRASVALAVTGEDAVLRLGSDATVVPGDGAEPGWVLRCRTRAAVAGGSLAGDPPAWTSLEVHFPLDPATD